jgi:hypothetical protein
LKDEQIIAGVKPKLFQKYSLQNILEDKFYSLSRNLQLNGQDDEWKLFPEEIFHRLTKRSFSIGSDISFFESSATSSYTFGKIIKFELVEMKIMVRIERFITENTNSEWLKIVGIIEQTELLPVDHLISKLCLTSERMINPFVFL